MVAQPWTQRPFLSGKEIQMPIYNFINGRFSNEVVTLDGQYFNQPLRRDIVHNVFEYFEHKGRTVWKRVKTSGDVAGSGRKPFPQKGRGAARVGNRRAPQRAGGGKAHGPVPRSLEFPINNKQRLMAMKIMLSAKLFEDKLIFVDSEELEYPKTQLLEAIVAPFKQDKLCFLTSNEPSNNNFLLAARNLVNVRVKNPQQFNVPDLLKSDYIFVTKQGLIDLEEILDSRMTNYFRNKKVASEKSIIRAQDKVIDTFEKEIIRPIIDPETLENYDDSLPLAIQSEALKGYVDDLQRLQATPDSDDKETPQQN